MDTKGTGGISDISYERAAREGKRGLVQRLVGAGVELGDALHTAVPRGHKETASDLEKGGTCPDVDDAGGNTSLLL